MDQSRIAGFAILVVSWLSPGTAQYENCTSGAIGNVGDGRCEIANNFPSCGYDGGDCCECTCADGPLYSCGVTGFNCTDPACADSEVTAPEEPTCTGYLLWLSDGFCDGDNNVPSCEYDGGDCCECTCVDGAEYTCGTFGFDCADPACADPVVVAEFLDCTGNYAAFGDGSCDADNNNPSCGYDGGDCCICPCVEGGECNFTFFDCLDPGAGDELFMCEAPPPSVLPCAAHGQRRWVVEDSVQARALAEAVNCSGGAFDVEWRGNVLMGQTIYVLDGTVLNITGAGTGAGMNGGSGVRLLTVVNASLLLSNLSFSFGSAIVGGAIAASGSSLALNRTSFIGNKAVGNGGALFVSEGSSVVFGEDTTMFLGNEAVGDGGAVYVSGSSVVSCNEKTSSFVRNTAGEDGGALVVEGGSHVSWRGRALFSDNTAGRSGGGVYVFLESSVAWTGDASFSNNTADSGGALLIRDNSSASWSGDAYFSRNSAVLGGGALFVLWGSSTFFSGETNFTRNRAHGYGGNGGAMVVDGSSSAFWIGKTTFADNGVAGEGFGGAVFVCHESTVSWSSETMFSGNSAHDGGAIYACMGSDVVFDGVTTFERNSATAGDGVDVTDTPSSGGALFIILSSAFWGGEVTFAGNTASGGGGAMNVFTANVSWSGRTEFVNNSVGNYDLFSTLTEAGFRNGGAVRIYSSAIWWTGETVFVDNKAPGFGGALHLTLSTVWWSSNTYFTSNSAQSAGAIFVTGSSAASWSAPTIFFNNSATIDGGAFRISGGSTVSWSGQNTSFVANTASDFGGALSATESTIYWTGISFFLNNSGVDGSGGVAFGGAMWFTQQTNASWSGETTFFGNTADYGGAVYILQGSTVEWDGSTTFVSNFASEEGGAVGSYSPDYLVNQDQSALIIKGATSFVNNTCGSNGGALALLGGLSVSFETESVSFSGNSAEVAGGAVFVSGAGVGPAFSSVSFVSNTAQVGGGVYATGSGNAKISVGGVEQTYPTTFSGCSFFGNMALATGGAIESASGRDVVVNTAFAGNTAGVGGALRLAGISSMFNCSFVENISDEGGGAAVSNIGYISTIRDSSFVGNEFACQPGTYVDFNESGQLYEVVCSGCEVSCEGCFFEEPRLAPLCTDAMDHSVSLGGSVSLETLPIERGYWRASTSSTAVFACYKPEACLGGVTGTAGYCLLGYEGPYCSICSDGYTASLGFACNKCSDSTGGIALAVFLAVIALVVAVAVTSYLMSGELDRTKKGIVARLGQYVPLQSLKIIIVSWQVLTQFTAVANVTYPGVYQRFLDAVNVLNFDLAWILPVGCVVDLDFHDRLLTSTIGPVIAMALLGTTYAIAVRRNSGSDEALRNVRHKHVSAVLLVTFLVYSSVSSILFQTFACEDLEDGNYYLRADYRIECDSSRHEAFKIYAGFMIFFYTAGIPALYAGLLLRDRDILREAEFVRAHSSRVLSTSDLWKPYRPSVYYYEVVECGRRILLTGVVVFIYPNTAAQIAVTLLLAFGFAMLSEGLAPYSSRWDTWISRMGHVVVFVSMYVALLLKVDVADEQEAAQTVFESILVLAHLCMVAAMLVEAVVLACSMRGEQLEDPLPRLRRSTRFRWNVAKASVAKGDPFSGDIQERSSRAPAPIAHERMNA